MNILPLSLFCLCLCCGFSRGGQPPEGAPVRFRINMDQAAGNKAPSTGPVPDQSTPLNAAKLLLRALQEKTDWKHEPYKSLPATSPFVSQLRLKSILSRMEAVQGYVTGAAPMEAAAENNKEFIVLDRPNPIGGLKIEGNVVEEVQPSSCF